MRLRLGVREDGAASLSVSCKSDTALRVLLAGRLVLLGQPKLTGLSISIRLWHKVAHGIKQFRVCYVMFLIRSNQQQRWQVGSGPRYQISSHVFARCASQKTHGHARIALVSRAILACPNQLEQAEAQLQIEYAGCCDSIGWKLF